MEPREELQLYRAVTWHLMYNLYPPAKSSFIDPAVKAIWACWDDEPEKAIRVPEGYFCKAEDLIALFRLEAYVYEEEEF